MTQKQLKSRIGIALFVVQIVLLGFIIRNNMKTQRLDEETMRNIERMNQLRAKQQPYQLHR